MEAMAVKKKEARRDQILEAAAEVFGAAGYHAANVADIIAKAGVARGTFYQYFESKRQLFDELLDDLLERVREAIVDVNLADPEKTVYVQLQENIERMLTFFRLPRQHHKHLKSTSMLERLNEEIRRRTYVVRIFPNADSCLRLFSSGIRQTQPCGPEISARRMFGQ